MVPTLALHTARGIFLNLRSCVSPLRTFCSPIPPKEVLTTAGEALLIWPSYLCLLRTPLPTELQPRRNPSGCAPGSCLRALHWLFPPPGRLSLPPGVMHLPPARGGSPAARAPSSHTLLPLSDFFPSHLTPSLFSVYHVYSPSPVRTEAPPGQEWSVLLTDLCGEAQSSDLSHSRVCTQAAYLV